MDKKSPRPITEARLRSALRTVATAIECHGEVYWPIFETLKAELDARKARRAQLAEFSEPASDHVYNRSKDTPRRVQP